MAERRIVRPAQLPTRNLAEQLCLARSVLMPSAHRGEPACDRCRETVEAHDATRDRDAVRATGALYALSRGELAWLVGGLLVIGVVVYALGYQSGVMQALGAYIVAPPGVP